MRNLVWIVPLSLMGGALVLGLLVEALDSIYYWLVRSDERGDAADG